MDEVTSLGVLFHLTKRIASLVEMVVNTLLNFGHKRYSRTSASSRSVGMVAQYSWKGLMAHTR